MKGIGAPYCRGLHIAQQAKIPGLILAGDMKPLGIAPGWTFDVKICQIKHVALSAVAIPCE